MRCRLAILLLCPGLLAWSAAPSTAQEIRSDIYYRLSTEFRGPDMPLGLQIGGARADAAELEKAENVSSQFWRIHPATGGTVRFSNLYAGPQKCLEMATDGPAPMQAELRPCADTPGQRWLLTVEQNGFLVTTRMNGRTECLDVIAEGPDTNRLTLRDCGFYASQFWTLTPTDQRVD